MSDDLARLLVNAERQVAIAVEECRQATQYAAESADKRAALSEQVKALTREVGLLREALAHAPLTVADAIDAEARTVEPARFERKAALSDAARIARGVQL